MHDIIFIITVNTKFTALADPDSLIGGTLRSPPFPILSTFLSLPFSSRPRLTSPSP